MRQILQIGFDSLLLSGLYAIGALGFTLIWGVLNVLNIAYAALIMLGGYVTFLLWRIGVDPLAALPVAMLVLFAVGWALQRFVIDNVVNGPHSLGITLTYGLNLIVVGLALYYFTADYRSIVVPDYLKGYVSLGGARLTYIRLVVTLLAVVLTAAMWWFMDRTETGMAIRATRLDIEAARLVGIEPRTIFDLTAAISSMLAGAMGGLVVLLYSATPEMGDHYLLQVVIVTVLGGLGSIVGPLIGAVVVGISTTVVASLWGATYSSLVGAVIVLFILVLRPQGLFGRRFYEG